MIVIQRALVAVSLVSCAATIAEPIKGNVELGFVQTSGNSETTNINFKLGLKKETEKWTHGFNATALGSSSEDQDTGEDETTAEKYTVEIKSERKLDERSFLYGISTWEDNRFTGYEYQVTAGVGYGYKVIAEEDKTLAFEIGPGYRYNAIDANDAALEPDEDEVTLRIAEKFDWKFSETAELNQYITGEGGEDNTIVKAGVAVKSSLTGALALKVGINATWTENPPLDENGQEFDDTDTETYANITYSF